LAKLLGSIGDQPEWNNFGHSQGTALLKAGSYQFFEAIVVGQRIVPLEFSELKNY
jgi:hypothetical protein